MDYINVIWLIFGLYSIFYHTIRLLYDNVKN